MQNGSQPSGDGKPAANPRLKLRALISGGRCIAPLSVFDPISARIAEDLGGPAMMLAGSVASMAILGEPDVTTLTLSELSDLARRIAHASDVPLIVDADHGYGNALNVRRTIEELEHAGVAALTIEDTLLPRGFGVGKGAQLISMTESCGKLGAALDARSDPNLIIVGRTGAAGLDDIEDTTARIRAYASVGVDMIFVSNVKTQDQLEAINAATDLPIFLSASNPQLRDLDALSQTNVRIVLRGHRPIMAAYQAVFDAMKDDIGGLDYANTLSAETVRHLTRSDAYDQRVAKYLNPDAD